MQLKQIALSFLLVPFGTGLLSVAASPAMAQIPVDPCDPIGRFPGAFVYDGTLHICWLADANLAGNAKNRAAFPPVSGINPNGTMDFPTAKNWVAALNGAAYLGHTDWQLPVTPPNDTTCAAYGKSALFGPGCTGSALGSIYSPRTYPNSVAPGFGVVTQLFQDLKLSYYWTQQQDSNGGQKVFSFSSAKAVGVPQGGGVTTTYPYYYVLPMVPGKIPGAPDCHGFRGVMPYTSGTNASQAVYDCNTEITWVADGNLAGNLAFQNTFLNKYISGDVFIQTNQGGVLVPKIENGAMLFATANQMISAMHTYGYLGSYGWQLPPTPGDLQQFAADLGLTLGDREFKFTGSAGSFQNLQPFYYWGCQQDQPGMMIQSPCTTFASGPQPMQWTFNFDDGFTGTADTSQPFFVMVYFPAPPLPPQCSTPMQCCIQAGGTWSNGRCQNLI